MADPLERVFVGLGSNLGDRAAHLAAARAAIGASGIAIVAASCVFESAAEGIEGAPDFLNQVLEVLPSAGPEATVGALLAIEAGLGRSRELGAARSRTIDLDLLLFGDRLVRTPACTVPHPRLPGRLFVLVPLAELAPNLVVPGTDATVAELLARHADPTLRPADAEAENRRMTGRTDQAPAAGSR